MGPNNNECQRTTCRFALQIIRFISLRKKNKQTNQQSLTELLSWVVR